MVETRSLGWLALAAALLALPAAAQQSARFARQADRFFVDCVVDGVLELCQLDTGSYGVGLRPRPEFEAYPALRIGGVMGAGGAVLPTREVSIGSLAFGQFKLQDVPAAIADSPFDHSIIGLEYFQRLGAFTFDFRRNQLRRGWPASSRACDVPFELSTGLIRIPVELPGRRTKAAWDTGASHTVGDAAFIGAHPEVFRFVRELPPGTDATSTGLPVSLYVARAMTFCGREFRDVEVVAVDMSRSKAMVPDLPDLTLGANLMAANSWSFDFKDMSWSLD